MTVYETITLFIALLALLCAFGNLIVACLSLIISIIDKDKKTKK
jgi:uncharacterized membrane protein YdfJ with MMPL/SSD domain